MDFLIVLIAVAVLYFGFIIYSRMRAARGNGNATGYRKHGLSSGNKNGAYYTFTAENGKTYNAFLSNWSNVHRSETVTIQYDTKNPRYNRVIG